MTTPTTNSAKPAQREPRRRRAPRVWPWLLPLGLLLGAIMVYPIFEIVRLSFTNATLVAGEPYEYTLDSYRTMLLGDDFRNAVGITFVFVLFSTIFQLALGLGAALLVNGAERNGLRGTVVTRTIVLTAWAVPGVIIGIIWRLLYEESDSGILNYLLSLIGFSDAVPFLSDPNVALVSVIVANVWRGTALSMILCYAGLKTIPSDVYEAAKIDGATSLQTLVRVTIPMMMPILMTTMVLVVVETFNTFDMVLSLTGGGPGKSTEVLALGVYDQIFRQLDLGQGAANAVVLMLINLVMIVLYLRLVERQERMS